MADDTPKPEMSPDEIHEIFETMDLPTAPKPVPAAPQQSAAPIVFFTVSGNSPPLPTA
jgi:hypothetical protein